MKNRSIKFYKDIESFLPYFYNGVRSKIRKEDPRKKTFKPLTDQEILDWYNSDSTFKEYADNQFKLRTDQYYLTQKNHAIILWEDPALEESRIKCLEALQRAREGGCSQRGGLTNVKTGHIKSLGEEWGGINFRKISQEQFTCSMCGYTGLGRSNKKRWHGKKCIHNYLMEYFNLLPNTFTLKQAREICESNNYPKNFSRKIVNDNYLDLIECIHKGTNGSNKDVPIYKKKGDL